MGRDFAKKRKHSRKSSATPKPNRWAWLLSGAFIGSLLTALVFFKLYSPQLFLPQLSVTPSQEATEPKVLVNKSAF